MGDTKIINKH